MRAELGELERGVLQIVWRLGQASADEVRQALARPLKESTVRTVLTRLEAKGFLSHKVEQRIFRYCAVKTAASLAANTVQKVADWFCEGSVDAVLLGMVEAKVLSKRDLQRILNKLTKAGPEDK
jgi:BlaI family transcriptional regulator, penicillinase repressor